MVSVTQISATRPGRDSPQQDIAWLLDFSHSEWAELPNIAAEWDGWDDLEALTFIVDWPLAEMRLDDLSRYAAKEKMTPKQQGAYGELLELVVKNRPILDRLRST